MGSVKCLNCGLVNWATAITCKKCGTSISDSIENKIIKADGHNGQLEMTKTSVIIKRKGVISFLGHGLKGDKEILISQISSVQFKDASNFVNGYIQLAFIGGQEAKGGILEATKDENTVMFLLEQQPEFESFKQELQERINKSRVTNSKSHSSLDELEKLASLRDKKIITDEEFEAKKRQLLGL
jgi:Short C-terminal domain/Domain of unknown function (DUF4429)